jgi:cation:H+ antiporter
MVRGSTDVAVRLGISPILIGLTVVSIGTSLPELAIGITAATEGSGELAVGNIAGTNMVNVLFILGLSALLLWVLAVNGVLSRLDGAVLVCGAIVYTVALIRASRGNGPRIRRVRRVEGGARVAAYLAYLTFLLVTQT